jgi:type IV pilus assembly protein PilN
MIKINLLPEAKVSIARRPESAAAAGVGGMDLNTILIIGLLVAGVLVSGYLTLMKYNKKKNIQAQIKAAQEEYQRLLPIIEQVKKFKIRKEQLQKKLDLINELRANQEGPVHLLDELADLVPDLLWLDNVSIRGTTMDVKGQALSPNAVAEFLQRLDDSDYFLEPSLRSMQEVASAHSFNIVCTFTYTPGREKITEAADAPKPKPTAPGGSKPAGKGDSGE